MFVGEPVLGFVLCRLRRAAREGYKLPPRQTPQEETKVVVDAVQNSGEATPELKGLLTQAADAVYTGTFGSGNPDVGGAWGAPRPVSAADVSTT